MMPAVQMPQIEKMTLFGKLTLVLRGPDGRIKAVRHAQNHKVYGTFNIMASAICNSTTLSAVNLGLAEGVSVQSSDTTLTTEISLVAAGNRTLGRYSHAADTPNWNLSFSFTDFDTTVSVAQAGIYTSLTGGVLYLKATFAILTKHSQDVLNVAWLQSIASAG